MTELGKPAVPSLVREAPLGVSPALGTSALTLSLCWWTPLGTPGTPLPNAGRFTGNNLLPPLQGLCPPCPSGSSLHLHQAH